MTLAAIDGVPPGFDFITQHQCLILHLGLAGNLYGGQLLSWLDSAAGAYAQEKTRAARLVTRALDAMEFKRPVKEGEIVRFYGRIAKRGQSSVTVEVRAYTFDPVGGESNQVTGLLLTFVSVDGRGHKLALPAP
jgi:acyl-CoA thioesterase YciA